MVSRSISWSDSSHLFVFSQSVFCFYCLYLRLHPPKKKKGGQGVIEPRPGRISTNLSPPLHLRTRTSPSAYQHAQSCHSRLTPRIPSVAFHLRVVGSERPLSTRWTCAAAGCESEGEGEGEGEAEGEGEGGTRLRP